MKYYIIAGEASGDLHAANLMKQIKGNDAHAEFRCWGGDLMAEQGGELVKHYRDLAFMGVWEVLKHLRTIMNNMKLCKADLLNWNPDVVVFVDYPGFNLRIAEFAKAKGFKTVYYISPQIWAWKQKRVHKINAFCDKVLCILPFEADFYVKHGYEAEFVGHPLLDAIADYKMPDRDAFLNENGLDDRPLVLCLPGSRKQEVENMLPLMMKTAKLYSDYQFVIAGAPALEPSFYEGIIGDEDIQVVYGKTYDLLSQAHTALVCSGTASLETALFKVPQVVLYRTSRMTYAIARMLVKIKYISVANLVMNRLVFKELIQEEMTLENVKQELAQLLNDKAYRQNLLEDYDRVRETLGGVGASYKAAQQIDLLLNNN